METGDQGLVVLDDERPEELEPPEQILAELLPRRAGPRLRGVVVVRLMAEGQAVEYVECSSRTDPSPGLRGTALVHRRSMSAHRLGVVRLGFYTLAWLLGASVCAVSALSGHPAWLFLSLGILTAVTGLVLEPAATLRYRARAQREQEADPRCWSALPLSSWLDGLSGAARRLESGVADEDKAEALSVIDGRLFRGI